MVVNSYLYKYNHIVGYICVRLIGENMKKNLYIWAVFAFTLICMPANAAQSVKVSALTPFNSLMPATTMKVMVLEKAELKNGMVFEDGTVILGDIIEVKQPKRAKLNASFRFKPVSYSYNGTTFKIEDPEIIAKYAEYKELDKVGLATSAATTVAGQFIKIPGLSQGVSFIKGVVKDPEHNRLKSGAVQVYKDSPLVYIEEGKDVVINKDQMFLLKFKTSKHEDLDAPEEDIKPVSDTKNITATPEQLKNSVEINTVSAPLPTQSEVKSIKAINPDQVLKEIELNSK